MPQSTALLPADGYSRRAAVAVMLRLAALRVAALRVAALRVAERCQEPSGERLGARGLGGIGSVAGRLRASCAPGASSDTRMYVRSRDVASGPAASWPLWPCCWPPGA